LERGERRDVQRTGNKCSDKQEDSNGIDEEDL